MSRPQPGFAAVDPPERWAPTRGRFRPERLEAPLDSLPGVGPTLKKRRARCRMVSYYAKRQNHQRFTNGYGPALCSVNHQFGEGS